MHAITSKPGRDLDVSAQVPRAWAYSQDMIDIEAGIYFSAARFLVTMCHSIAYSYFSRRFLGTKNRQPMSKKLTEREIGKKCKSMV